MSTRNNNIPSEYDASNLTLKDVLSIIESNIIINNNETPNTANIQIENNNESKEKILGRFNNEKLFLNHNWKATNENEFYNSSLPKNQLK